MKILLIGEFSGVHNNLKKGLQALGHQVTLLSDGDGYKMFSSDSPIRRFKKGYSINTIDFALRMKQFTGYDVVQFISPFALPFYYQYFGLLNYLFSHNKKIVYYACGNDLAFLRSQTKFSYFPFDHYDEERELLKPQLFQYFINHVDIIVPAVYDYSVGYEGMTKLLKPIPFPCSGEYSNNVKPMSGPLKILFGVTRPEIKGADYIIRALDVIRDEYPNVYIEIVTRIPFQDWLAKLQSTDVLIDQCRSYSYGMNAIFALEKGCIVLSGSEEIAMNYLGIKDSAVINIKPDSTQIVSTLESLINSKEDQIIALKNKSLYQAREFHDPISIAKAFTKVYQNA